MPLFTYPILGDISFDWFVQLETAKRRTQLQASILATSMKECTFQPKTNEALNRELLRSILEQEDDGPPESIASASTC